jgi:hypothetical protein
MARVVQLDWGTTCRLVNNTLVPAPTAEIGLYQITRVFGAWESLLYIGIVWSDSRSFRQRMNEHRKEWVEGLRGIHFRFADVVPLRGLRRDRQLVEEIEGALIAELQPPENTSKKSFYSIRSDLEIHSYGNRGFAPKILSTTNHSWA